MDAGAECILTITALRLRDTVLGRNVTATISTEPSPGLYKTHGGEGKREKSRTKSLKCSLKLPRPLKSIANTGPSIKVDVASAFDAHGQIRGILAISGDSS